MLHLKFSAHIRQVSEGNSNNLKCILIKNNKHDSTVFVSAWAPLQAHTTMISDVRLSSETLS